MFVLSNSMRPILIAGGSAVTAVKDGDIPTIGRGKDPGARGAAANARLTLSS